MAMRSSCTTTRKACMLELRTSKTKNKHKLIKYPQRVRVAQSSLTLCNPVDYTLRGILQARIPEQVAVPFSRGSFQPRDSLPAELPGKPKNTGLGSRSFLQGICPTQGSNPGLPHCRRVLYHLSHKGSPILH